jgi:pimeloyl-ACP methyl ester carboxylesterase
MIANDPEKLELIHQGMVSTTPMKPRNAGYDNDFEQWETMKELPLAAIHCPKLIAHGTADDDFPFSHAEAAYHSIPKAQLHRMEGAWHVVWVDGGAEEMVRTQVEFAKAHGGA